MKIVFLVSRFPWPLEKGDKLRAYHFIRLLSVRHEIHLVALTDRVVTNDDLQAISQYCASVKTIYLSGFRRAIGLFRSFFWRLPFQTGYFYHPGGRKVLKQLVTYENPDAVFCQLVRVADYVKGLKVPTVIDFQDALSMNMERRAAAAPFWSRWFFRWEGRLLKRFERQTLDRFGKAIIISEPDRLEIDHPSSGRITVVPNGVDFSFFSPGIYHKPAFEVVFTGNMGYPPNIEGAKWLASEIMPQVRKVFPEASLLLAGASPSPAVKRLASAHVEVTGWMDDIRDAYRNAKVFVAPMLTGSGLQNKLLEAMAMKMPCVTTSLANASLMAVDRTEILVADTTGQMAAYIVELLSDQNFACNIAQGGHKMVHERFSWHNVITEMEKNLGWQRIEMP